MEMGEVCVCMCVCVWWGGGGEWGGRGGGGACGVVGQDAPVHTAYGGSPTGKYDTWLASPIL